MFSLFSPILPFILLGFCQLGSLKKDNYGRSHDRYFQVPKYIDIAMHSEPEHFRESLEKILIPRVPGSDGSKIVRDFITLSLLNLGYTVTLDNFVNFTPFGLTRFHNIIAKLNPNAKEYIVLACHYDSKYFDDIDFVGATDSAVPCAMLLNMAKILHADLTKYLNKDISLMLIFFDGEEAFEEWSDKDSLYGSRHLATQWKKDGFIKRIKLFVLLDLIGGSSPKFHSFFPNTANLFGDLIRIEQEMAKEGLFRRYDTTGPYFQIGHKNTSVQDDHLPFLKNNVPILHLISVPYPDVWHTANDDWDHINFLSTDNVQRILQLFLISYLDRESNNNHKG